MRFLIPLFVAWSSVAQLPVVPLGINTSITSTLTDYTNLLYADFQTDDTASLSSAYVNGAIVVYWTNISIINPIATSWDFQTSSGVWPYFTNNVTPTGKGALEFISNNGTTGANQPHWGAAGSNQPNTIIMCVRFVGIDGSVTDTSTGGREIIGRSGGQYSSFAGVGYNVGTVISSNFMILTSTYNGANCYIRTNGVLVGTGNSGTDGMGVCLLSGPGVNLFKGQLAALRVYAEIPSTNNLHVAEQNLATRYLGITLPSP